MNWKLIATAALAGAVLTGCASTGVMQIGQDRWLLSDSQMMTRSGAEVVKSILVEANAFCVKKGLSVEVINVQMQDYQPPMFGFVVKPATPANATVEFTCK